MEQFQKLGLNQNSIATLRARTFDTPTPIQRLAIPILLQGEDLVGQAQTGTGKTVAFGLPIIEDTRPGRGPAQSLVLCPTRELANQLVDELNKTAKGTPFKAHPFYGGVGYGNQIAAIRRGDITCIVACPGRLLDLLEQKVVDLSRVRHVVLDEADRMFDMGFIRDIERIFQFVPKERQTMLFSATMPAEVRRLAERYLRHPETVRAEQGPTATELAEQFAVPVPGDKTAALVALLSKERPEKSVIFTRTKHGAKRLAKRLKSMGYKADALQGNLSQNARDRVMAEFRDGAFDHLVATDVASRGLDVKGISHVVNFDFPTANEDYVHRIGRTGRAGVTGRAFLFVAHGEERDVHHVERVAGIRLTPYELGPVAPLPSTPGQDREPRDPSPGRRNPFHANRGHGGNGGYGGNRGNGGPRGSGGNGRRDGNGRVQTRRSFAR
ncbi:MAG: DEAD/DEAH box helicase [Methanobacteriota archaeon]